jgi:hypothetical protein
MRIWGPLIILFLLLAAVIITPLVILSAHH